MSRRAQENLIAVAVLIIFIGAIAMSLGYGPRARLVPLPIATLGLILTVLQLIWQNRHATDELQVDWLDVFVKSDAKKDGGAQEAEVEAEAPGKAESGWRREIKPYLIVVGLLALVLLFGPIPAIFAFTLGYFIASGHYGWPRAVLYTTAFTTVIYLLFVTALEIQLYHGVLEPVVSRF